MIPFKGQIADELFGVDLSHLSSEEKAAILQVAARAKQLEYAAAVDSIPPPEGLTEEQSPTAQAEGSYEDIEDRPDKDPRIGDEKGEEEKWEEQEEVGKGARLEDEMEMEDMSTLAEESSNQIMSQMASKSVENVREIDRSVPRFNLRRSTSDLIVQASQNRKKDDVSFARRKTFPAVISYLFRKGASDEDVDEEQRTSHEKSLLQRSANAQKLRFMTSSRGGCEMSLSEALVRKLTLDKSVQLELRKQMEEDKKSEPPPPPPPPDVVVNVVPAAAKPEVAIATAADPEEAEVVAEVESTQIPKVVVTSTDGATVPVDETHEVANNWAIPYLHEPVDGVEERDNDYYDDSDDDSSEYSESSDSPIVGEERTFAMNQNHFQSEISHSNFGSSAGVAGNMFELNRKNNLVEVDAKKEEPQLQDGNDSLMPNEGNAPVAVEETEYSTQDGSGEDETPTSQAPSPADNSQQHRHTDQFESFQPESSKFKFASLKTIDSYKLESNSDDDDDGDVSSDDVSKTVDSEPEEEGMKSPEVEEEEHPASAISRMNRDDDSSCIYAFHGSSYYDDDDDGSDFSDDEKDDEERLMLEAATSSIPVYPEDMEESSSWCDQQQDQDATADQQLRRGSGLFFRRTLSTSNFDELLNSKSSRSNARASLPKLVTAGSKVTINFRSLPESSSNAPKRSGSLTAPVLSRKAQSLEAAAADAQATSNDRETPQPPRRMVASTSKQNLSGQQSNHDDHVMMTPSSSPHLDLMADARPRRQNAVVTSPSSSSQRSSLGDSPTPSTTGGHGDDNEAKCGGSNLSDIIDLCQLNALIDALKGARDLLAGTEAKPEVKTVAASDPPAATTTTQTTMRKIDTCVQTSFESVTTTINQQQQECHHHNNNTHQHQQKYNNNNNDTCQCACSNKCNHHQQQQQQQFNNRNDRCITWLPQFYPYPSPPPPPAHLYHDCNRMSDMMSNIRSSCSAGFLTPQPLKAGSCGDPGCSRCLYSQQQQQLPAPAYQHPGLPVAANARRSTLPTGFDPQLDELISAETKKLEMTQALTDPGGVKGGKLVAKMSALVAPSPTILNNDDLSPSSDGKLPTNHTSSLSMQCLHDKQLAMRRSISTPTVNDSSAPAPTTAAAAVSPAATTPNYHHERQMQELQEFNKQKRQKITKEIIDNQHHQQTDTATRLQPEQQQQQSWLEQQYLNDDYSTYSKELVGDKPASDDYPTSTAASILPITRSYTASVDQTSNKWYNQPNTMPRRSSLTSGDSLYSKITSGCDSASVGRSKSRRRLPPPPPSQDEDSVYESSTTAYSSWSSNHDLASVLDTKLSTKSDVSSRLRQTLEDLDQEERELNMKLRYLELGRRGWNSALIKSEVAKEEKPATTAAVVMETRKERPSRSSAGGGEIRAHDSDYHRGGAGSGSELRHGGRATGSGYGGGGAGEEFYRSRNYVVVDDVSDILQASGSNLIAKTTSGGSGGRSHQQSQPSPYSNDVTEPEVRKNGGGGGNYDHVNGGGRSRHRQPNKSRLARRVTTSGFEDVFDVTSSIGCGGGGVYSSSKSASGGGGGYRKDKSGGGEERSGGRSKRRHQSSDYENVFDDRRYAHQAPSSGCEYQDHQEVGKRRSSRSSSASNRSYSRQTPRRHRSTSADVGMETDWRDQEYYSKNDDYYQQLYLYCKPNEYENSGEPMMTNEGTVVRGNDWNEMSYEDSTYAEFSHKPRD